MPHSISSAELFIDNSSYIGIKVEVSSEFVLRWGIIGLGKHTSQIVIPAMQEAQCTQLCAVATTGSNIAARSMSAALRKQTELTTYSDYQSLLETAEIDAVYIGLPNHLHAEWCIKSLEAGKHVICEKPLATSLQDALKVREAARYNDRRVLEGFMYRFHPQHREVRNLLAQNAIGRVLLLEAHFHFFLDDLSNIRMQASCAGGALLDVGCYLVDCARWIFSEKPTRVSAHWLRGNANGVDEFTTAHFSYADGRAAHLTSGVCLTRQSSYILYGTAGKIIVRDAFRIPRNKQALIEIESLDGSKRSIAVPPCNQAAIQISEFGKWVAGAEVDETLFGDGVENAALIAAITESATTGTTQTIKP